MTRNSRPSIPQKVVLQVWTEAAGRCQFNNCNKPLWYNELTLNKTNFSQIAHIIGASSDGPRGSEESENLAKDPTNLMLMCPTCHKEIDTEEFKDKYPDIALKKMKRDHEERVKNLLDRVTTKTTPVIFTANIGESKSSFTDESIKRAVIPNYPDRISSEWYRIAIIDFKKETLGEWERAKTLIESEYDRIQRSLSSGGIQRISVFAIASQPLLMYLGYQIGDKIPVDVYEPKRSVSADDTFLWENLECEPIKYSFENITKGSTKNVCLLFELSDFLSEDKYSKLPVESPHVYTFKIEKAFQGFLKREVDKKTFVHECRFALNKIQKEVGNDCAIHVLPAMPASLAVEFGRLIQKTKDPLILIYENINGDYKNVLNLNSR